MQGRRPFDPKRARGGSGQKPPPEKQVISPSRLNELIQTAIRTQLPSTLTVLGEIGDLTQAHSGHLYFSLKDPQGEIRCVMWRSNAARIRFEPQSGMEVIATGGIDVYPPRGTYQLLVRSLEPRGVGALEVAFRQLQQKLASEGLFDNERKRPLPTLPNRIGVVTSPSGAAIRDILQTLRRRCPTSEVLLFPCRVQGDGAGEEVAAAIHAANRHADQFGGIDVLIVGRGGGSLEDLWAFNEEVVARAIYASDIPVVSAVGHEVDVSIADMVADVRAATPTAAAELVVPVRSEIVSQIETLGARATRAMAHHLRIGQHELFARLRSDALAQPLVRVQRQVQRLDEVQARLQLTSLQRLQQAGARLAGLERRLGREAAGAGMHRLGTEIAEKVERCREALRERRFAGTQRLGQLLSRLEATPAITQRDRLQQEVQRRVERIEQLQVQQRERLSARLASLQQLVSAFDPQQILQRGYSITRDARTGKVLRDASDVPPGTRVKTELADGSFESTVDDPRQGRLF